MLILKCPSVWKTTIPALEEGGVIHQQPVAFITLAEAARQELVEHYRGKL